MKYLKLSALALLLVIAIYIALPNLFQINGKKLSLGLDLKGGANVTFQIDFIGYIKEKLEFTTDEIVQILKAENIPFKKILVTDKNLIELEIKNINDVQKIKKILEKIGDFILKVQNNKLEIAYKPTELMQLQQNIVADSILNIQKRIDDFGVKEGAVYSVGQNRISVELPGIQDVLQLKQLIGKTAKLNFHLVKNEDDIDVIILKDLNDRKYTIQKKPSLSGSLLNNASARIAQNGKGAIIFKFNSTGAKKFERLTKENTGKLFAIVLDDKVLTAPMIKETIFGGQGEITGSFTVDEAREIAILLKSGALPAKLEIVEERIIGPTLGAGSIESAKKAGFVSLFLVILFMVLAYRWYGVIASCALIVNLIFILAILTAIQATLTLPGIAGLILTVGMAVDTNVLIFERIKEEFDKTNILKNSIFKGFKYAKATIIDANITTLIAALTMLFVGSGPVKGFGVTLSIGILSSMFTAIFITYVLIELFFIQDKKLEA